ncbi:MAG: peptidylprolyl isomerase [Deltaproteobacteria bacterium]|nr:peptidylprolyl isomerase [Deltaproteobacteria bacterium]
MFQRFCFVIVACGLALPVWSGEVVNRVVAIVNGDIITQTDLDQAVAIRLPQLPPQGLSREAAVQMLRQQALEHLIDERLLQQVMQKANVEIGETEIDEALQAFLRERGATLAQLEQALAQQHIPLVAFRERLANQLRQMKFVQSEVAKKVSMSDEELRHFYRRHAGKAESAGNVRIAQILLPVTDDGRGSSEKAVLSRANKLAARAQRGEDFAALARTHSAGPEATHGGELGSVDPTTLHPMVAAAVTQLRAGTVSGPIRSKQGYHIIKVLERGTGGADDFTKIKPQLQQALFQEKARGALEQYVAEMRAKAYIEIKEIGGSASSVAERQSPQQIRPPPPPTTGRAAPAPSH